MTPSLDGYTPHPNPCVTLRHAYVWGGVSHKGLGWGWVELGVVMGSKPSSVRRSGPFKLCWVPNTKSQGIGGYFCVSPSTTMSKGYVWCVVLLDHHGYKLGI